MKLLFKIFSLMIITLIFIRCQNDPEIIDIIPPVKLISGVTDSIVINDIYYSEKYDIAFNNNPNLDVKYYSAENKLLIKADPDFEGMTFLEFEADMNLYQIPVITKKEKLYDFSFKPDKDYDQLTLFGSFNGWNRTNLPLTDNDGDGIYRTSVALDPGVYQYKFFGDGAEIEDPLNPIKVSNGMGSFNSIRTIEDTDTNKFFLHINNFSNENNQITFSFYLEDEEGHKIENKNIFALFNNSKVDEQNIKITKNLISLVFDKNKLKDSNTLRVAVSKKGRVSNIQTINLVDSKPVDNNTFTWNDGIIYSLMIDRFYDGDTENNNPVVHDSLSPKANYMGGDLRGVLEKLNEGYFESLGINVIWISPVYDNPNEAYKEFPAPHRYYSGYHGYWPINFKTVDEHFGNIDHVKEIIKTAHNKGIKVLLDFVSNHTHTEHSYFKEHRDWYGQLELPDGRLNLRFWDEFRLTTWFEPYLASFDYLGSEEVLEEMTDIAVWWLNETGADGYRHDAVKHVPNKFWRKLNDKIKKEVSSKRELPVYQIGETFGSYELISSYVNNGQLHSQFNFNLYDVALPTFIRDETSFSTLDKEMHKTFSVYGVNHLMGNIMDSHDKNRFMAFADGDLDASEWSAIEKGWSDPPMVDNPESYKKLILYMAYMNTIPGLPVIYYGSEFGMSGASDPDNRRMMRFGTNLSEAESNTLSEVKKIINIRKEHPALRNGDFYTLIADKDIYAYVRSDMNERILVVLNKSKEQKKVDLILPYFYEEKTYSDISTKEEYNINKGLVTIMVDAEKWRFFYLL